MAHEAKNAVLPDLRKMLAHSTVSIIGQFRADCGHKHDHYEEAA